MMLVPMNICGICHCGDYIVLFSEQRSGVLSKHKSCRCPPGSDDRSCLIVHKLNTELVCEADPE